MSNVEMVSIENNDGEKIIQRIKLLDKNDIKKISKCQNGKALKILRMMYASKYATKIGEEYYTDPASLEKFLDNIKGKQLSI